MDKLPREILLNIFSKLPVTSLLQAKCVSKAWQALTQDPLLINMHFSHALTQHPYLILHSDCPLQNQLYLVDFTISHHNTLKKITTPITPEFDVIGSCNSLLCLSDSSENKTIYIYNPCSKDFIELPQSPIYQNQEVIIGFGYHSSRKEYKVVKIVYYPYAHENNFFGWPMPQSESAIQIFTLGSSTWRSIGYINYHFIRAPSQVLVNGRLHWVAWYSKNVRIFIIVSFDLADEQFRIVPKPNCCGSNRCGYQLVNFGDCLAATAFCNNGNNFEIWVMKDYGVEESWVRQFNVGTYMPRSLEKDLDEMFKISKFYLNSGFVRVLCLLKDGEILLEYECRALVIYDPKSGIFKDLNFQEMPGLFETVVHVGSLNWF